MAVGFIFGEGQKARTPEDLKRQRAIVDSLRRRTDYTPKTIGEAIGYIGDAISEYRANKDLEAGEAASADRGKSLMGEIVGALGNGGGSTGYSGGNVGMPEAAGGSGNYRDAIAGIESGGRYDAVGPTHKTLGRALGKYQVMEANIGPWSEKYLGRRISSDEFLKNPQLQDAIFDGEFGSYVQKYGPEKAAQAWFGGEGGVGKVNRKDSLGTSVGDYGKKFMAGLGQGVAAPAPAPVQTASLDPSAGVAQATGPNAPYPMEPSPYDDPQQRVALGGQPISAPQPSVRGDPNQRIAQAFAPVQATNVTPKAGRVLPQDEQTQRILGPLLGKQPIGGEFAGMQPPETTAAIPQPQPVSAPAPQPAELPGTQIAGVGGAAGRTAPINGQGGQFPVAPQMPAQGAFPPAPAQPGQLDLNRLIELASDPNTPELGQMIVQTLLKNRLTPPDPMDALNRQKAELDIQKSQRDLETPKEGFRKATPEEAQQYGSQAGQFGPDGRFYPVNPPSGTQLSVDPTTGAVTFQQGSGVKPLTEGQSKLTLFQSLQTETQPVLLDLEKQFDPANIGDAAARSTPIAGNFFQSEQGQIYQSAATAWAEGALRIATGAAATPEEMERTKKAYFAQPGDTPNTIAFKAQMREMYNRAIDRSLGKETSGALPKPGDFAKTFKGAGGGQNNGDVPSPQTQEEFDALPSGSIYIDPEDGKQYRKP